MNLLFVSNLFPDQTEPWRGLDNATLLHALRAADAALRIRVLAFRPSLTRIGRASNLKARPVDEGFHPVFFWNSYVPKLGGMNHRLFGLALSRAVASLPADFKPHAILSPWLFPDACASSQYAEKESIPIVAVAQGSDVHRFLDMPMRRRAIVEMTRRVKAVVTRSQDLERQLASAGVEGGKVRTIYNGVDVKMFRPGSMPAARDELNLQRDERILLFVGNFLPVKGLELLLQSLALVVERSKSPVRLALIGGGPLESAVRAQAVELKIADRLLFVGRCGAAEVAQWMQAADAVCLTSHNEGVPNVVLESLSSGRVPICTDVGGISEVVEPVLGRRFLIEKREAGAFASAIMDALEHPAPPEELHHSMQRFSWENCANQYLELLDPMASGRMDRGLEV